MRYYKIISDGYIVAIGTGTGGVEIKNEEYTALDTLIHAAPIAPDGYCYRLKDNLTWELTVLPQEAMPVGYSEELLLAMTNAELEQILCGYGVSASMNKTNMVRLILAMQGGAQDGECY